VTTHNTAPNQFVDVNGARYAYRRFGKAGQTPIVLFQHYIGTMDWWDPLLTDGLAKTREVILFDNRGVGISSGQTPNRIDAMAADAHDFIRALGVAQADILGFSIGGMVAQELVLNHPGIVRKVIFAGTGPRGGEGMQEPKPNVVKAITDAGSNPRAARPYLFFSQTENGRAAAERFTARNAERKVDLDPGSSPQTMQAHNEALAEWGRAASHRAYVERLGKLALPALIMNGNNDIMVDTVNSYTLFQAIPRAQLIIYPDSGHGALFQYAELFVQHASIFLDQDNF
jgi:pimeloyl-ACP methyl ester carboxylesterase